MIRNRKQQQEEKKNRILILGIDYRVTRTIMNKCGEITVSEGEVEWNRKSKRLSVGKEELS